VLHLNEELGIALDGKTLLQRELDMPQGEQGERIDRQDTVGMDFFTTL
jgi:hypothetical protein